MIYLDYYLRNFILNVLHVEFQNIFHTADYTLSNSSFLYTVQA